MGIRFYCPNGHKLNVKAFQAGMRGICPYCGAKVQIPLHSTRPSTKELKARRAAQRGAAASDPTAKTPTPSPVTPARPTASQPNVSSDLPPLPTASPFDDLSPLLSSAGTPETAVTPDEMDGFRAKPIALDAVLPQQERGGGLAERPLPAEPSPSASTDPLADANVVWYVRPPNGEQYGPAGPEVVRIWLHESRITPDSYVWREGWRDWQLARDVFPQLLALEFQQIPRDGLPEVRLLQRQTSRLRIQILVGLIAIAGIVILAGLVWYFAFR